MLQYKYLALLLPCTGTFIIILCFTDRESKRQGDHFQKHWLLSCWYSGDAQLKAMNYKILQNKHMQKEPKNKLANFWTTGQNYITGQKHQLPQHSPFPAVSRLLGELLSAELRTQALITFLKGRKIASLSLHKTSYPSYHPFYQHSSVQSPPSKRHFGMHAAICI